MKILAINLLRLGDLIMTTPALEQLKAKYPGAEIHLLMNRQFAHVSPLLKQVDEFHFFDRNNIQQGLGDAELSIMEPFDSLTELVNSLQGENFDCVFNFTQNRLSGWLATAIDCETCVGLNYEDQQRPTFGSNWFRYFNEYYHTNSQDLFHYADILQNSVESGQATKGISLEKTLKGEVEANEQLGSLDRFVAVQPLTSDEKKNLPLNSSCQALKYLYDMQKTSVVLLGAPNERQQLQLWQEQLSSLKVPSKVCIVSLEGALSVISRSEVLVTADTAIKHLACAAEVPIVEVCLGSSDWRKTGLYANDGLILAPKTSCYPCAHANECHRPSRECADELSYEGLASAIQGMMKNDWSDLKALASEFSDEMTVIRTKRSVAGYWIAHDLSLSSAEQIDRYLEKSSWKLYLDGASEQDMLPMGTEALAIYRELKKMSNAPVFSKECLSSLEKQVLTAESQALRLKYNFESVLRNGDQYAGVENYSGLNAIENSGEFRRLVEREAGGVKRDFLHLRQAQMEIERLSQRSQMKSKLIKSMNNHELEWI